jgi:hypothetical protein
VARTIPAPTPGLLALLLGVAGVLPVAGRAWGPEGGGRSFLLGFGVAAALALLARLRMTLPAIPGPFAGPLWLLAGTVGAALLGRHAVESFAISAAELPLSARVLGDLDLGDAGLLALLVLLSLVPATLGLLRRPRPGLGLLAALVLLPLLVLLGASSSAPGRILSNDGDLRAALAAAGVASTLSWSLVLAGPEALPLDALRPLWHGWLPRLLGPLALLGLPLWLLAVHGSGPLLAADEVVLDLPADRSFPPWGDRVGAGIEFLISVAAALSVLLLCARVAARRIAPLRGAILPPLAAAAGLLAALVPLPQLLVATAVSGWMAVLCGGEVRPPLPAAAALGEPP